MTVRSLWPLVVAAGAALGCQDRILAPGVCPEFCPQGEIVVRDTLLANSIEPVGSYRGYRLAHEVGELQVVGPGGPAETRGLIVFYRFGGLYEGSDTTVKDTIVQTDSIRFTFNVLRRNTEASGVQLALHGIPITTDSSKTYADMEPYFADSTLITTVQVPDTLKSGVLQATVQPSALPHFIPDSLQLGMGLRISSPDPAFLSIGSTDSVVIGYAQRFVLLDSIAGGARVTRSEVRGMYFKTFVVDTTRVAPPVGLLVGGVPAARAFVKLSLPSDIVDQALVLRATLLLTPARPTFGAPSDTFRVRVEALGADFGPKSPLDTTTAGSTRVPVGTQDTVRLDITSILRSWRLTPSLPRTVVLRVVPEGASIDQFELATGQTGGSQPVVRITYGLPFRLPGQ